VAAARRAIATSASALACSPADGSNTFPARGSGGRLRRFRGNVDGRFLDVGLFSGGQVVEADDVLDLVEDDGAFLGREEDSNDVRGA
jgi:hypothetical protein